MTNKTFKELCKELKKAQKARARAIKEENSDLEAKANAKINIIIAEMKQNKDYFIGVTASYISQIAYSDRQYNKLMNDYETYPDRAVAIENAYEEEITSDTHINKILGKKDKKVAIITSGLAAVLGISAFSGVVGYKLGHKKDDDKDYTTEYTTEYTTDEYTTEEFIEEYVNNDSNVEVEYEEKETTTIRFKSDDSEYKNNESNTNNKTNTTSNTNNTSNTKSDNNKSTDSKSTKTNNKSTDKNNNKTTKDNNKNSDTNTKDNKNNKYTFTDETKDTVTEETTETKADNSDKQDYIIPTEEIKKETVTEEPAPKVPDNMPIEEDENDVIYYDINGNETTKEEADKSFEKASDVKPSSLSNKEENTSKEIKEDYIIPAKEKHNEEVIEITTPVPEDMPIEEDLITEYKALKAQLEETKALLEEQEQSNNNAMSLSL